MNGQLDELIEEIIHNKTEIIIKEDYAIHQITSINNQLTNNNLSFIDFKGCEDILKQEYNIKAEEELLIYKIENIVKGFNIPIIEYILFTQNEHIKLNLTICNNITVEYNIPVSINENEIYKYDPSSQFYNDKCNKYSKDGNVDITLFDRKNEYNNNNMSLCESKCSFKGYNSTNSKSICDCNIKTDMTYSENDTNNLLNKIQSEKSSSNLDVTQCINEVYSAEEIKSNSGFYILLIILVIFIIIFIIFCVKGKDMLENKLNEVIYKKFENSKKKPKNKIFNQMITAPKNNKKIKRNKKNMKPHASKISSKSSLNESKKFKINNFDTNIIPMENEEIIKYSKENIPDSENDYELNNLSYEDALKYDKRTCCDYYCSLIKNKPIIAFTFCSFNDYNSGIIKKFVFFLSFALHYTINSLFFNDSNMHQIYEDEGKYNFSYQSGFILISAISSTIILGIMLEFLILTDKNIIQVKNQTTKELAIKMKSKVLKCINIKFAIFFMLNFMLLILFWIYLTCLNGTYENTQIYIIENTFISFGFSLFYPFIINIFPSFLRMASLDKKKKDKNSLYNISKIIQIL